MSAYNKLEKCWMVVLGIWFWGVLKKKFQHITILGENQTKIIDTLHVDINCYMPVARNSLHIYQSTKHIEWQLEKRLEHTFYFFHLTIFEAVRRGWTPRIVWAKHTFPNLESHHSLCMKTHMCFCTHLDHNLSNVISSFLPDRTHHT
jgi:hypothetical protein